MPFQTLAKISDGGKLGAVVPGLRVKRRMHGSIQVHDLSCVATNAENHPEKPHMPTRVPEWRQPSMFLFLLPPPLGVPGGTLFGTGVQGPLGAVRQCGAGAFERYGVKTPHRKSSFRLSGLPTPREFASGRVCSPQPTVQLPRARRFGAHHAH